MNSVMITLKTNMITTENSYSQTLIVYCMKLKLNMSMKILCLIIKEMFDFSNYSTKSKCHDDSNKLVIGKMKDETAGVAIEEFVELKPKMYSYLVDDDSEHKKAIGVNSQ